MASNLPAVSVVIPARNAGGSLREALESVREQTYGNIIEVIVAAGDEASAVEAQDATVVSNPSGTTPQGLNLAVERSTGDIIVRCDAHSVLPADYVARAIETLLQTGADTVGGMQVAVGETPWERAIAAALTSRFGAGDARHRVGGDAGPAETVYLGVFKRETLQRLGGFDVDFRRTQDYELNHRIIASGGVVWFDPMLRVSYHPRGSLRALAKQYYEYGQAKRQFARKHPGSLRWRQMLPPTTTALIGMALLVSPWYPIALAVPGAYALGVAASGAASGTSWWRVTAALTTMHLSWGLGFLVGPSARNDRPLGS